MHLHILGTASGTEPVTGRRHTAFALEIDDRLYWFDAGEGCAWTAHMAGIPLPALEAVFITHTHMDHIGGLPHLLWTVRKLSTRSAEATRRLENRAIDIFIPNLDVFEAVYTLLRNAEGGFRAPFRVQPAAISTGVLFERHGVRVEALANRHGGADFPSFSFRLQADNRRIVFSGDVKSIEDIDPLIDGCDLLLMETGHHAVEDVCTYLMDRKKQFGRLVFVHHGRAVLADPAGARHKAVAILGDRVTIAEDGDRIDL